VRDDTCTKLVDRISFRIPCAVQRENEPLCRIVSILIEQATRQPTLPGAGQTHQHEELLLALAAPAEFVEECAAAYERGDFDLLLWSEGLDARGRLARECRIRSAEIEGGLSPAQRVPPALAVDLEHFAEGSPSGRKALSRCSAGGEASVEGRFKNGAHPVVD
jgi:hypothetical protein